MNTLVMIALVILAVSAFVGVLVLIKIGTMVQMVASDIDIIQNHVFKIYMTEKILIKQKYNINIDQFCDKYDDMLLSKMEEFENEEQNTD